MTTVEALKDLYVALGGDLADVQDMSTNVAVLNAISAKYNGASDAVLNPEAVANIAAVAGDIGGGGSSDFVELTASLIENSGGDFQVNLTYEDALSHYTNGDPLYMFTAPTPEEGHNLQSGIEPGKKYVMNMITTYEGTISVYTAAIEPVELPSSANNGGAFSNYTGETVNSNIAFHVE